MCAKYRGVRLMEHSMKVWEKILEGRLRDIVEIDENQFGFQQGKSTVDAIFVMRQLQERYGGKKKELFHIFVDLEKAFNRVPREAIVWALRRQNVPERLITLVMALYVNSRSKVKALAGTSGVCNRSWGTSRFCTESSVVRGGDTGGNKGCERQKFIGIVICG